MSEEIKNPQTEPESELDRATESIMDDLDGKNENPKESKREAKQLKEENRKLSSSLAETSEALEKTKTELAEMTDKYMRVYAEYENFRKRSKAERDAVYTDAYADALKEILPVIDNLERAAQFTEAEKLAEGLSLIFKSSTDMLTKLGVEAFGEAGESFDPNIHNAVMHVEDESMGENEIIDVFQKGYKKGDRIIRFAMVRVAN